VLLHHSIGIFIAVVVRIARFNHLFHSLLQLPFLSEGKLSVPSIVSKGLFSVHPSRGKDGDLGFLAVVMFVFATTSIFREAQRPIAIDGHAHQLGRHPNGIGTSISMSMSMSISMYINIGISMGTLSRQRQLPRPDKRPTQRPHRQGNVIPIQSLGVRHVLDVGIRSPQIAEVVEAEEDQLRFGRDAVAHGVGVDGVVLNVVEDVFVVMVVVVVVVVVVVIVVVVVMVVVVMVASVMDDMLQKISIFE